MFSTCFQLENLFDVNSCGSESCLTIEISLEYVGRFAQHNVNVIDAITFILDTYLNKSHKVPAYHRICIEIDPHSHGACARLTEILPPALQDYIENAIIMYLTTL